MNTQDVGQVILLSGPVGSGKTTVAKYLLPRLPDPACYIEGDQFWKYIAKSENRATRENFGVLMRSMTAAAVPFARSGFTVLLDFSIPPNFLKTARAILKEIPFQYVVLRPKLEVCAQRASDRVEGSIADYKPYQSFYDLFLTVPEALNDDGDSAQALADRVYAGLSSGAFALHAPTQG